ncbi:DUF2187 family protein [Niallia oryzisoli]|uniref:DUF2187 family protein n=1 Tax=Niallia oryzisoli TaxID=1737571 RepID=UPI003736E7CE
MTGQIIACEGNRITFTRNGYQISGEVLKVKDASVLVSISQQDAELIQIETPVTVVAHKHYQILH